MVIDYSRLKEYEYRRQFYQSSQWRKLSEGVRKEEPLCPICLQEGLNLKFFSKIQVIKV